MPFPLEFFGKIIDYLLLQPLSVYIVGGTIRERFLGRISSDIDVIVPCGAIKLAISLKKSFGLNYIPLDRDRDIARVIVWAQPQITLDIASFAGEDLYQDLRQRDLTINAIAAPIQKAIFELDVPFHQLKFEDPFSGLEDLKNKTIRGIQPINFDLDPLRILRVFRFAADLNFSIDPETSAWISSRVWALRRVSAERILHEIELIFQQPSLPFWLNKMQAIGILSAIFPDNFQISSASFSFISGLIEQFEKFPFNNYKNISNYFDEQLTGKRDRSIVFKLFILFWTHLRAMPKNGLATSIKQISQHLKLGRKEDKFMLSLAEGYLELKAAMENGLKNKVEIFHLYRHFKADIIAIGFLILIEDVHINNLEKVTNSRFWQNTTFIWNQYFEPQNCLAHPPQLISGHKLKQTYPKLKGPDIGRALLLLQEEQALGKVRSEAEALGFIQKLFSNNT